MIHSAEIELGSETQARKGCSMLAVGAGFLFSFRTVFVLISARWLNVGTEPGVLFGFALEAIVLLAALMAAFGLNSHSQSGGLHGRPFQWVVLYLSFSGCSLLWSAAASPGSSALYWYSTAADVAIVVLLARATGPALSVFSLVKGYVAGAMAVAVIAWMMPAAADLRLGDPEYLNTNQIGNLCAFAVLICALLASRVEAGWSVPAIFLGVTLLRSLSKASLVAFIAAQAYRLVSDRAMSMKKKWLLVAGAVVLTTCFWSLLEAYIEIYTAAGNQVETLTGRTGIWLWALDAGLSRPFLGNGFDAMWKVAPPFGGELFEARHAENELLQQFFAYGLCGVALLVGVYGSLYRRFRRLTAGADRGILMSLLVYVVVRGLAEAEPFDLLLPLWLITALTILARSGEFDHRSLLQPERSDRSSAVAPV